MLRRLLLTLLIILGSVTVAQQAKLVRARRDEVRIVSLDRLKDETRIERLQEMAKDLPPLPIEDEVNSLNDEKIGKFNEGGVLIPVDENGRVLKGYEHLLRPIVLEVDMDDLSGSLPRSDEIQIRISDGVQLEKSGLPSPGSTSVDDYDDESDGFKLPAPLPNREYDASEEASSESSEEGDESSSNVLKPASGELGDPIPFVPQREEKEESKEIEVEDASAEKDDDPTDEEIEAAAKELLNQINIDNISKWASNGLDTAQDRNVQTSDDTTSDEQKNRRPDGEGYLLDSSVLSPDELEDLKKHSQGLKDETQKIRSARIKVPDSGFTSQPCYLLIFTVFLLFL